jgi:undecaprenyl-diphosphatase
VDGALFRAVIGAHAPWLDTLCLFASAIGGKGFVWFTLAAIAAVFPRRRMAAWRLTLAVALTFLLVDAVVKPAVGRVRPFNALSDVAVIDTRPSSGSFPSGHAASAFAGALAAGRMFPLAQPVFWPLAALIAFSRVYVGVHWPSDVIAGAIIGLACGWFALGGRTGAVATAPEAGRRAAPAG